jgi:hypothetical protein
VRQVGSERFDFSNGVAVDGIGNVYMCGSTNVSLLGEPHPGSQDAFVIKYDGAGNVLWSQQVGSPEGETGTAIAVDPSGNSYIVGIASGSFGGPHVGDEGHRDGYIAKLDTAGNFLWARHIGASADNDSPSDVAVDSMGNAYAYGSTEDSLAGPSLGSRDAYLLKYDRDGSVVWTKQLGTSADDGGGAVAVDKENNVFITGITSGDFGGPSAGGYDAFLAKYAPDGSRQWVHQWGTPQQDYGSGIASFGPGTLYVAGQTIGNFSAPWDAFLAKFTEVPEPGMRALVVFALVGLALQRAGPRTTRVLSILI